MDIGSPGGFRKGKVFGVFYVFGGVVMKRSETSIIDLALKGDSSAYGELFRRYRPLVSYIVRRRVPQQIADDLIQVTFICAFQSLHKWRRDAPLKYWLSAIARYRCSDWWRSSKACREVLFQDCKNERGEKLPTAWWDRLSHTIHQEAESRRETRQVLLLALEKLSAEDRLLLDLRYIKGWNVEKTAQILGISTASVKTRSFRALRRLKSLVEIVEAEAGEHHLKQKAA